MPVLRTSLTVFVAIGGLLAIAAAALAEASLTCLTSNNLFSTAIVLNEDVGTTPGTWSGVRIDIPRPARDEIDASERTSRRNNVFFALH